MGVIDDLHINMVILVIKEAFEFCYTCDTRPRKVELPKLVIQGIFPKNWYW